MGEYSSRARAQFIYRGEKRRAVGPITAETPVCRVKLNRHDTFFRARSSGRTDGDISINNIRITDNIIWTHRLYLLFLLLSWNRPDSPRQSSTSRVRLNAEKGGKRGNTNHVRDQNSETGRFFFLFYFKRAKNLKEKRACVPRGSIVCYY